MIKHFYNYQKYLESFLSHFLTSSGIHKSKINQTIVIKYLAIQKNLSSINFYQISKSCEILESKNNYTCITTFLQLPKLFRIMIFIPFPKKLHNPKILIYLDNSYKIFSNPEKSIQHKFLPNLKKLRYPRIQNYQTIVINYLAIRKYVSSINFYQILKSCDIQ